LYDTRCNLLRLTSTWEIVEEFYYSVRHTDTFLLFVGKKKVAGDDRNGTNKEQKVKIGKKGKNV
jgi:hypothetical protein